MNSLRSHLPRFLLILVFAAVGIALCAILLPAENRAVANQLIGFPDSDVQAQQARPLVLAIMCFLPVPACIAYALGGTLDRYITRQFLGIFGVCISALFVIWLLIDLSDNVSEFRSSKNFIFTVGTFYCTRAPAVILLLLPYSLLLALLYSLGKLSTNREIIAVIQSGRGVVRTTLPLVVAGVFCTLFCMGLNYHWAPVAEGRQDEILAEATGKQAAEATKVLYRNPERRRLWMIGAFPPNYEKGLPLLDIEVTTTGENRMLESRLSAPRATWNRENRVWTFESPVIGRYTPGLPAEFIKIDGPVTFGDWPETPWQLIKPGLTAANLGIPDLNAWLRSNSLHQQFADPAPYLTQWHYRWAQPFTCLVTVLLAAPLAIHFSRRGPGGGVLLAVILSALMLLVSNIVLAFGEAGTLRPALAAWLPNLIFTLISLYLYRRRITGRPIYQSLRRLLPGTE